MLHLLALKLLGRLHREFDVDRITSDDAETDLIGYGRIPLARPTVALIPRDPECAPLIVAFTSFPGLLMRVGSSYRTAFPTCGCDACGESAEEEGGRLRLLVDAVTAGHFREQLERQGDGSVTAIWEWEAGGRHWREEQLRELPKASALAPRSMSAWKPWTRR